MSKPNSTHILLVLDASGSMNSVRTNVTKGLHTLLAKQRDEINSPCTISTFSFNNYLSRSKPFVNINDFQFSSYFPNGGTALNDGICFAAVETTRHIQNLDEAEQPEKVMVIVITDGHENTSKSYSRTDVKNIIAHYEENYEWDFLFVGSNQDAYATGTAMGFKSGKALSFAASGVGVDHALAAISNSILRYRRNGAPRADEFFTSEDIATQNRHGAQS